MLAGDILLRIQFQIDPPILCTATDPKLPENAVDLAIMIDVYHECSDPAATLKGMDDRKFPFSELAPGVLMHAAFLDNGTQTVSGDRDVSVIPWKIDKFLAPDPPTGPPDMIPYAKP